MNNHFKSSLAICAIVIISIFSCKKDKTAETTTVTDIDGNVYQTVRIGTQVWMVENLKTTRLNDNTPIQETKNASDWENLYLQVNKEGYCWYNNNVPSTNKDTYGALYNAYAVATGKLAPTGWRIATDSDWEILKNYLIANGYNHGQANTSDNIIAKSLASATGWKASNKAGAVGNEPATNNKSKFNALPGGFRSPAGDFFAMGDFAQFWTFSAIAPQINQRQLHYDGIGLGISTSVPAAGLSVRCVRIKPAAN